MLATLPQRGVIPAFSRPSVSNDNPYSESLFRTLKYRPEYPEQAFTDWQVARARGHEFVEGDNTVHLHSAIKFVTPEQRHTGEHVTILSKRKQVYRQAKAENPGRWRADIRNGDPVKEVHLNPEKQKTAIEENKAA